MLMILPWPAPIIWRAAACERKNADFEIGVHHRIPVFFREVDSIVAAYDACYVVDQRCPARRGSGLPLQQWRKPVERSFTRSALIADEAENAVTAQQAPPSLPWMNGQLRRSPLPPAPRQPQFPARYRVFAPVTTATLPVRSNGFVIGEHSSSCSGLSRCLR